MKVSMDQLTFRFAFTISVCCLFESTFSPLEVNATPRQSLTAGTPCVGCHFSPNGGGGRTELGWGSMQKVGALSYKSIGLSALEDQESNQIAELASVGIDIRVQGARLGNPSTVDGQVNYPDLSWIPMQFQPYLAMNPIDGLTLYGSVMPGPDATSGDLTTQVYAGMSAFEWWGSYSLGATAPTIRVGQFQPTFGIRHDDHTLLLRGDALKRRFPIIPPNFTELGAEMSYQPMRWLRMEFGGFSTRQLQEVFDSRAADEPISLNDYALVSRVSFLPQFTLGGSGSEDGFGEDGFGDDGFGDDDFGSPSEPVLPTVINTWFGASSYLSNQFHMINAFMGLGSNKGLSGVAELSFRDNPNVAQKTFQQLNTMFGLNYAFKNWLVFNARVERGQTQRLTESLDEVAVAWQYVAGLEFFPLPGVELRPEYRLIDTLDYRFGQATLQVHLFY